MIDFAHQRVSYCDLRGKESTIFTYRNAPSPAATSSLAIARHVVDTMEQKFPIFGADQSESFPFIPRDSWHSSNQICSLLSCEKTDDIS